MEDFLLRDFTEEELLKLLESNSLNNVEINNIIRYQPLSKNLIEILKKRVSDYNFESWIKGNPRAYGSNALEDVKSFYSVPLSSDHIFIVLRYEIKYVNKRVILNNTYTLSDVRKAFKVLSKKGEGDCFKFFRYKIMCDSIIHAYSGGGFFVDVDGISLDTGSYLWRRVFFQ